VEAALKIAEPEVKKQPRKPRAKKTPVAEPAVATKSDHLWHYATAGVAVNAGLSMLLNGYANAQHATVPWAGWGMGLAIPVIILLLAKVAGLLYRRGHRHLAAVTAGSGIGLLALSVWHCASSIALLTGSGLFLAVPMAIAIDAGFVCCELSALYGEEGK
jgi:hypothetical protein